MASSRSVKSAEDNRKNGNLKRRGIERTSGACPWGCGRQITNGGSPLLVHLNTCKGRPKAVRA